MHPVVALMAVTAAESFGKELGQGAAQAIFGGFANKDAKAIAGELTKIWRELEKINRRLDSLFNLVSHLPSVIIGGVKEIHVDAAYEQLDAQKLSFIAFPRNQTGSEFQLAYAQWLAIVRLEDRPSKLMMLPGYTQYIRAAAATSAETGTVDQSLRTKLQEKKAKVEAAIAAMQARADGQIKQLTQIQKTHFAWDWPILKPLKFEPKEPFVSYSFITNPRPNVPPYQMGNQAAFDARAKEVRNIVSPLAESFRNTARMIIALATVDAMMKVYVPNLRGSGTVEALQPRLSS